MRAAIKKAGPNPIIDIITYVYKKIYNKKTIEDE